MGPWLSKQDGNGSSFASWDCSTARIAALRMGVQRKGEAGRRPCLPMPGHLPPHAGIAWTAEPLLRRKWIRPLLGGSSLFGHRKPPDRRHGSHAKKEKKRATARQRRDERGALPLPTFIAKEGQPPASTTSRHDDLLHAASFRQVEQLPRQHGEVETPTSHQSSRVIKATSG